MFNLQSTANLRTNGVKMLVYGRAGAGKTSLCATCPAPLVLSAEAGLLSLSRFNLPYIHLDKPSMLKDVLTWLYQSKEAQQFQTICVDSVSEVAEQVISQAKATAKDPRQAYGELIDVTLPLLKGYRDLPGRHVLFTAKQGQLKDEFTGAVLAGPDAPGKELPKQLPYLFDEIFQLAIGRDPASGGSYRYIRTQPDFNNDAKDRSGKLAEIEPPDIGAILAKICS